MNKELSDIDFINAYDLSIGELYTKAKSSYRDAPIQTLVELRSIIELMVAQFLVEFQIEVIDRRLNSKVDALEENNVFAPHIVSLFNDLRVNGNRAAHKYDCSLTYDEFAELALKSLKMFCELVELLQRADNQTIQTYTFDENVNSQFFELSYRALFEEDKDAKFRVGVALVDKYREQFDSMVCVFIDERALKRGITLIEEAAADRHPEAMFECGYMLMHGIAREKDIYTGMVSFHSASNGGFIKAMAHFAETIFEHYDTDEEEINEALKFLFEAVSEGDAHAQFVLSEQYKHGKFVVKNSEESLRLLKLSADGGYTNAMFEYGKLLIESGSEGEGFRCLVGAVNNGNKDALLYGARICVKANNFEKAEEWFEGYFEQCDSDYYAYIEYAKYLHTENGGNIQRIKRALELLVIACRTNKTRNGPSRIKRIVDKLSPMWLEEYGRLSRLKDFLNMDDANLYVNFDPDGRVIDELNIVHHNCIEILRKPGLIKSLSYTPQSKNISTSKKSVLPRIGVKIGRNNPCPCKSGKKYKQCCAS